MLGTKDLRDQYDRVAKMYMDILRFHLTTQKAVHLDRVIGLMEHLDKQLSYLGEK
jgi:hypothetical protein